MTTTKTVPADLYFERVNQLRRERAETHAALGRYRVALYALACQLAMHGCAKDAADALRRMADETRVGAMAEIYRLAAETVEEAERDIHPAARQEVA